MFSRCEFCGPSKEVQPETGKDAHPRLPTLIVTLVNILPRLSAQLYQSITHILKHPSRLGFESVNPSSDRCFAGLVVYTSSSLAIFHTTTWSTTSPCGHEPSILYLRFTISRFAPTPRKHISTTGSVPGDTRDLSTILPRRTSGDNEHRHVLKE